MRSTSSSTSPSTDGPGGRRGAGDRLRDVILARVDRLGRGGGRGEPDLELAAVLDSRLEDRQRLERRRAEHVAGAKVELRRVAGADDDVALELAVRERALLVRAGVLERDPAGRRAAEADGGAFHLDPAEEADGRVLRRRPTRAR